MPDPTLEQIGAALKKADAEGNTADARRLAQAYASLRNSAQTIEPGSPEAARMTHGAPPEEQFQASAPHPIDKIKAMIRGNAAEDLPSVYSDQFEREAGWSTPTTVGGTLASIAGSDEDVANYIKRTVPDATFTQDANGNAVVALPNGKRFYLNQPGLDTSDVLRGIGKAAAFAPAAKLASTATTVGGKLLLGGLASGGTDAAMQIGASSAGGNPSLNPTQTAIATGLGGAAEIVPAIGGRVAGALGKTVTTDARAAARGAKLAEQAGIPTEGLTQADMVALGRQYPQVSAGVNPNAALAESEFGMRLTRGQKTGDVSQLRREEMLRSSGTDSMAGRAANHVADEQRGNLEVQAQRIQDFLAKRQAGTPAEATEDVIGGVQRQSEGLNQRINQAYDDVRAQRAAVDVSAVHELPVQLRQAVRDTDVSDQLTPATARTLEAISQSIGTLPENAKGLTMRAVESTRKKILGNIGAAKNPTDRRAMMKVKSAFDGWVDDAFDRALISGDKEALDKLKEARALRAEYGSRFEPSSPRDQAGKLVQKLTESDATPDEFANAIFGSSQIAPKAAVSTVRKVRAALGPETDAWNAVRAAVVGKALTNRAGEVAGPQAIVSNLTRLFKERPALMNTLYTKPEQAFIQRFGKAVSTLIPPGTLAKSSGTGERMMAYFTEMLRGIPFGGKAIEMLQAPGRAATAARMTAPVTKDAPRWQPSLLGGAANAGNQTGLVGMYRRAGEASNQK